MEKRFNLNVVGDEASEGSELSTPEASSAAAAAPAGESLRSALGRLHRTVGKFAKPAEECDRPTAEGPAAAVARAPSGAKEESFKVAAWLVAAGAAYCGAELAYNLCLVEFLSSPGASDAAFENLERVGKGLSAIGLSMFAAKALLKGRMAALAFAVMVPCAYVGIDRGFDAAIDAMPKPTREAGYWLGAYRSAVADGKIADPALWPESGKPSLEQKLAMSQIPMIAAGRGPVGNAVRDYILSDVRDSSRTEEALAALWSAYSGVMGQLRPAWGYYLIESKRYEEFSGPRTAKEAYKDAFAKRSGGIPPSLPKEEFYARLAASNPSLRAFSDAEVIPARPEVGVEGLKMGDFPPFLGEADFRIAAAHRLFGAQRAVVASVEEAPRGPDAKKVAAAAFIPPMAQGLSLVSCALNFAAAAVGALRLLAWRLPVRRSRRVWPALTAAAVGALLLGALAAPPAFVGPLSSTAEAAFRGAGGKAWATAAGAEMAVLKTAEPLLPILNGAFVGGSAPATARKLQVSKVSVGEIKGIDSAEMFKAKAAGPALPPDVDPRLVVDESKATKGSGYWGELDMGPAGNPYAKKGGSQ